jgi:hypothetical protein
VIRVRQDIADSAAVEIRVVKWQHDIRQQHALALTDDDGPRGALGYAGARGQLAGLCLDKAVALLCLFRCQPRNFQGLEVLESGTLDDRQRPTHRRGIENQALVATGQAFGLVLHQGGSPGHPRTPAARVDQPSTENGFRWLARPSASPTRPASGAVCLQECRRRAVLADGWM